MKKVLFSVVAAVSALSAFAQADSTAASSSLKYKAEPNRFGVEAGIDLKDGFAVNGGRINAIYSLSEKLAVRCGFSLTVDRDYKHDDQIVDIADINTEDDQKNVTMETKFEVVPGIVYSFKGTERLEPYIGAEVGFGFEKNRTRESQDYTDKNDSEANFNTKTVATETYLGFGANGFTGFNFYLCKDLFVGAELNFGFMTYPGKISNSEVEDSRIEKVEEHEDKSKNFSHTTNIDLKFHPSVRLGWKF